MSQPNITFTPGHTIKSKYRLDQLIAVGGMGEVYRATHLGINRVVAIKTLKKECVNDKEIVARFVREAKAANVVHHSNIVEILDIDNTEDGIPFIVQEFVQGHTLSKVIKKSQGGLPVAKVLDILIPVLDAIGEAHAKGVVHRDIKPSNIVITKTTGGFLAKILDFGISKMTEEGNDDTQLTRTSAMLGSPAYMSPEQIKSPGNVTPRSDVWSIGVMLYEVLSGQLPFLADQASAIMVKICTENPVSLYHTVPGLSSELVNIVDRCLSRHPEERFADARQIAMALRNIRSSILDNDKTKGTSTKATFTSRDIDAHTVPSEMNLGNHLEVREGGYEDNSNKVSKRSSSQELFVERSKTDMTTLVGAFCILGLALFSYVILNSGLSDSIGPEDVIFHGIVIGLLYFATRLIHQYGTELHETAIAISVFGIYGACAAIIFSDITRFADIGPMVKFSPRILSAFVATTAAGFAAAGVYSAIDDLSGDRPHMIPGVSTLLLSLLAVIIVIQMLFLTFTS